MQLVKIEKAKKPFHTIDWKTVDSLSLEERLDYFIKLADDIVHKEIEEEAVEIGRFVLNSCDKKVYQRCIEEYIDTLNQLNRNRFKKKIASILHNFLPKEMYKILKNNEYPTLGQNFYELIKTCIEPYQEVLYKTVTTFLFISFLSSLILDKDNHIYASANTPQITKEDSLMTNNMSRSANEKNDNSNNKEKFYIVSSIKAEGEKEPIPEESKLVNVLNHDGEEDTTTIGEELSNIMLYPEEMEEELPVDNYEIREGYHLTKNNITYEPETEIYYHLVYAVNYEGNGTYEDSLGVTSVVLNRAEDDRYEETDILDIISKEGQFVAYNREKAIAFAANPEAYDIPQEVYNAINDALYKGIRNNDYVEFRSAESPSRIITENNKVIERYQIVPNGNKYCRLANNLGRVDRYNEEKENTLKLELEYSDIIENFFDDAVG